MSPAVLEQRVAVCRVAAEHLLADLRQLVREIKDAKVRPVISLGKDGICDVYDAVCGEIEAVIEDRMEPALDYLTPRADDDDPGCCAHRKLQKVIDRAVQPPVSPNPAQ